MLVLYHLKNKRVAFGQRPRPLHVSHPHSSPTPGVFYTHFYNHAHRPRLEKLACLELSISPNGFVLSASGSRWRFQKRNGRHETASEVKRLQIYNGYV
jgi:hypothetical protein